MKVSVIGAGSWGTALSILLARNGHDVALVGRENEDFAAMRAARENLRYLPGFVLPEGVAVRPETDLEPSELVVLAVPSAGVREAAGKILWTPPCVALASKGLEPGTGKRLSEVVAETLPGTEIGVLSGPNLAVEIVRGIPTAAVAAFSNPEACERVLGAFGCATYRLYLSDDVLGVELAGALKNVLAIGAGLSDGLGFGDNTKGALLARGLGEMVALGVASGARIDTFMGLAGVGDLFATASSRLSRNYRVGLALAERETLQDALARIDQVAEGVSTSESAMQLARRYDVEMPVFGAIDRVIRGKLAPMQAVRELMERAPKAERLVPLSRETENSNAGEHA